MEVIATKEDVKGVQNRLEGLDGRLMNVEMQLGAVSQSVTSLHNRMNVLEEKQDTIISILDRR